MLNTIDSDHAFCQMPLQVIAEHRQYYRDQAKQATQRSQGIANALQAFNNAATAFNNGAGETLNASRSYQVPEVTIPPVYQPTSTQSLKRQPNGDLRMETCTATTSGIDYCY